MSRIIILLLIACICTCTKGITQNPDLHYDLNNQAIDISGNGNDGIIYGTTPVPNELNTPDAAMEFDGVDDYVDMGSLSFLNGTLQNFAITFWFKSTIPTNQEYQNIFGTINTPGAGTCLLIDFHRTIYTSYTAGHIFFYLRDNDGKTFGFTIDATDLFDDQWHCISFNIQNSLTGSAEVYADGVLRTFTIDANLGPVNYDNFEFDFALGAKNNRGDIQSFYKGSIDEFIIFKNTASQDYLDLICSREFLPVEEQSLSTAPVIQIVNGILYVETEFPGVEITITDISGRIITRSIHHQLAVSDLSKGTYIAIVAHGSSAEMVKFVIP